MTGDERKNLAILETRFDAFEKRFDEERVFTKEHRDESKAELKAIRQDMQSIKDVLTQAKGGWRLLVTVGTIAGALGAFLGKFIPFFQIK